MPLRGIVNPPLVRPIMPYHDPHLSLKDYFLRALINEAVRAPMQIGGAFLQDYLKRRANTESMANQALLQDQRTAAQLEGNIAQTQAVQNMMNRLPSAKQPPPIPGQVPAPTGPPTGGTPPGGGPQRGTLPGGTGVPLNQQYRNSLLAGPADTPGVQPTPSLGSSQSWAEIFRAAMEKGGQPTAISVRAKTSMGAPHPGTSSLGSPSLLGGLDQIPEPTLSKDAGTQALALGQDAAKEARTALLDRAEAVRLQNPEMSKGTAMGVASYDILFQRGLEAAAKQGKDINDPMVKAAVSARALAGLSKRYGETRAKQILLKSLDARATAYMDLANKLFTTAQQAGQSMDANYRRLLFEQGRLAYQQAAQEYALKMKFTGRGKGTKQYFLPDWIKKTGLGDQLKEWRVELDNAKTPEERQQIEWKIKNAIGDFYDTHEKYLKPEARQLLKGYLNMSAYDMLDKLVPASKYTADVGHTRTQTGVATERLGMDKLKQEFDQKLQQAKLKLQALDTNSKISKRDFDQKMAQIESARRMVGTLTQGGLFGQVDPRTYNTRLQDVNQILQGLGIEPLKLSPMGTEE